MQDWIDFMRDLISRQSKLNESWMGVIVNTNPPQYCITCGKITQPTNNFGHHKSMTYLFYSREALITDYGKEYVLKKIQESEKLRHYLKTCGKPTTDEMYIEIWMAKLIIAQNLMFERSEYYE